MIAVVVVSYNPNLQSYTELLSVLLGQSDRVIVVDNSEKLNDNAWLYMEQLALDLDRVAIMRLGENRGLATALNIGIEIAIEDGADFVVLSDQDSAPSFDMVPRLAEAYGRLSEKFEKVAGVGPTFADLYTGVTYPFQAKVPGRFFYGHVHTTADKEFVEALTLITSGTLLSKEVLLDVGFMHEGFFIDQIDIEWCHRARAKGYRIFGAYAARMHQHMGESVLPVWFMRWRKESLYSPLRIYYRIRNFVFLLRLDYIDARWKIRSGWYWLGIIYAHVVFGPQKTKSLLMAAKGLLDGIRGKAGKYVQRNSN